MEERNFRDRIEQYRVVEPENQEKIDCSYVPYPLPPVEELGILKSLMRCWNKKIILKN